MFEVKGKDSEGVNKFYLVENAMDVEQAVQAAREFGLVEVYAVYLSKYKEVFRSEATGATASGKWYCTTILALYPQDNGKVKRQKYKMLFEADSVSEATAVSEEQLSQGYEMESVSVAETTFDDVI